MSIEIDIVSGDAGWPMAKPLLDAVWPPRDGQAVSPGHLAWAAPQFRVLLETDGDLVCHVGLFIRTVLWKGRKHQIGGIGGLATRLDSRERGYASLALNAAVQTLRDHEALDFALLVCKPHNAAFYAARGWHSFPGGITAEQPGGRVRLEAETAYRPHVFDFKHGPREGVIDLCGLPW